MNTQKIKNLFYYFIFSVGLLNAQKLKIDESFGNEGFITQNLGQLGEFGQESVTITITDSIESPVKKYYGYAGNKVYCLNANKTLDTSFGENGITTIIPVPKNNNSFSSSNLSNVIVLEDGTLVVHSNYNYSYDLYNYNDFLITSLTSTGKVNDDFSNIQSDGHSGYNLYSIIKGKNNTFYLSEGLEYVNFSIKRYSKNGLDTSFTPVVGFKGSFAPEDSTFKLTNNDKLLVKINSNDTDFVLKQYNVDGSLDTSFATNGIFIPLNLDHQISSFIIDKTTGNIVSKWVKDIETNNPLYLKITLSSEGNELSRETIPKSEFYKEDDKKLTATLNINKTSKDQLLGRYLLDNGNFLGLGKSNDRYFLIRYLPTGYLDTSFNQGKPYVFLNSSIHTHKFNGNHLYVLFSDGNLKKYNQNGIEDTTFSFINNEVTDFNLLSNGEVIIQSVIKKSYINNENKWIKTFQKLTSNGNLIPSFKITEGFFARSHYAGAPIFSIAISDKGEIYSISDNVGYKKSIHKYSNTGQLISKNEDANICGDFTDRTIYFSPEKSKNYDLKVLQNNKLLIFGGFWNSSSDGAPTPKQLLIAIIDENGNTLSSFTHYIKENQEIQSLKILEDSSILFGGTTYNGDFFVSKLNANGTLDKAFGTHGEFIFSKNSFSKETLLTDLHVLQNGSILGVGTSNNDLVSFKLIAQEDNLTANEVLNNTNKIQVYPNPTTDEFTFQSTDKIIAVELFDLTGKLVYESSFEPTNKKSITVSNLTSAVYKVQLTDVNYQKTTHTLIKK